MRICLKLPALVGALGLFLLPCSGALSDIAPAKHIRQSLHEFIKDKAKVAALIRGVAVMKQRDSAAKDSAEYRTSWEYWGAIHGYPGPTSPSGTVEDYKKRLAQRFPNDAPLFSGFFSGLKDLGRPDQPAGLAEKLWATCEHGTDQFFSWHRMYLYFFERVLRKASGDPNFTLPYWDYTNASVDPSDPANAPTRLPAIYSVDTLTTATGDVPNPLFERRRTAGFGTLVQLDALQTDVDSALGLGDFAQFQSQLDGGLHGFIHCAVGNGCLAPYIGLVPFSANDPVFWVHHANIDRLWSCWTARNGESKNPVGNADWMGREFSFVDENGDRVSMKVADLFGPNKKTDYAYDNETKCFRQEPSAIAVAARNELAMETMRASEPVVTTAKTSNVKLDQTTQTVVLGRAGPNFDAAIILSERPVVVQPTKAVLKLEGVGAASEPGVSVKVLLGIGTSKPVFVGVISFFHAFERMHAEHASRGRDYFFDVSRQLQELSAAGAGTGDVHVQFVASNGLVGTSTPTDPARYQNAQIEIRNVALEITKGKSSLDLK